MKKLLSILIICLFATSAYGAVSSETLININDATTTTLAPRRVKDAGNITDASTSGVLSVGPLMYNGTTWDRLRGDTTNGVWVNVKSSVANAVSKANAAVQTLTEGSNNALSTDLQGNLRTTTIGSATIATGQVTVDTTAGGVLVKAALNGRKELLIQNIGATDMYCGNTGVTTTTGFKIAAGVSFIEDRFNGAYYCIVGAGSTTAAYREVQ